MHYDPGTISAVEKRAPTPVGAFCFLGLVSSAVLLGSLVSPSAGRIRNLGKSFSVAPCGTYPDPVGSTASISQQEEKGQGLNTENTETGSQRSQRRAPE